jgi:hypothetical protein
MLLQHLKRRATQIDLPLILGTTNMYTDWYLPSQQEAVNIITECIINGNVDLVNLLHNFSVGGFMPVTYTDFSGIHGNAIRVIHHGGNGSAYATYVGNNSTQWRVIRKIPHTDFNLGDFEVGGIVVYIDNTNNYSLIIKQDWGPTAGLTNLFAPDLVNLTIDDGLANTIEIANQSTTSAAIDTLDFISRIYLPVLQNSTDYKLDIDWGDGTKRRYEDTGTNLFNQSFTYTEDASFNTTIDLTPTSEGDYDITDNNVSISGDSFVFNGTDSYMDVEIPKPVSNLDNFTLEFEFKATNLNQYDVNGTNLINIHSNTPSYADDLNLNIRYTPSARIFKLNLLSAESLTDVESGTDNINGVNEWNKVKLILSHTALELTLNDTIVYTESINANWIWYNNPQSVLRIGKTRIITSALARHFQGEIKNVYFNHFPQPDIKIWARNGADNNLNFNRTSWLTHGDTLIQEGDMSKEPLDISIDANQNGIPDDWE